ncbi:hypothetical protein CC78DRAFT_576757 [Lojkania enalia]|uniref:DUF6594 domain-containing protein n=1 Tax=Lojkania enalia TaxID=147567 RepID=A0A9P4KJ26_9PLEO|nr:hypothetical protein CC78DRAFT_576757 [Didymosphaeria enalia]
MKGADPYNLNHFQHFLSSNNAGHGHSKSLICIRPREDTDAYSNWLGMLKLKKIRTGATHGTIFIADKSIFRVTSHITSIIASLIPILPVIVPEWMYSTKARIRAIAAFNMLISVCLTVSTEAKRMKVFGVTAA